jgi:4-hydroxy-tetrahydrodipicolinate reductase
MKNIRVALHGVGAVGALIARHLLEKQGIDIVAALDIDPQKLTKDLGEVLQLGKETGINITDNVEEALEKTRPDIVVHATSSYLKQTFSQISALVRLNVNVVSTCEELSYPYLSEPKLAQELDVLAKKHDVTVLGTGINPGFLMDTLVITLTAPCTRIDRIEVTRIMNAATRRAPFQKKIGAGLTVEEFNTRIKNKQITGHVGLEQSIAMIADALVWKLDRITVEPVQPVIAKKPTASKDIQVPAGKVAGLRQTATAIVKGKEAITLNFEAYIGAEQEYDAIIIHGNPNVAQKIQPCIHGDTGTVAMIVNAIPRVINAPAGLLTMKDLPIPHAAPEDARKYLPTE